MRRARSARRKPHRYVVGVDFGTLSGRATLVEIGSGREVASAVHDYADGVIETHLPRDTKPLPPSTALQNPADYLKVLSATIPAILRQAQVTPDHVVGLGTDFTCCTMLPTKAGGTPLCFEKRWRRNPHAWVKLWKHHAAQPEADFINEIGRLRGEKFIKAYGGKYSSEWFFSKLLETVRAAPEVYDAADRFIEAGDWIVWQLCGRETRSLSAAGFKAMFVYENEAGRTARPACPNSPQRLDRRDALSCQSAWTFPSKEFFKALHPRLENVVEEKLDHQLLSLGSKAGGLTPAMAKLTGLLPGTPIAAGNIDAHVAVPACGVTTPGKLVMILGTSTCHLLLSESRREVEGICGVVREGIVPGFWGYEAGQAGVGDMFAWFVNQAAPASVAAEARKLGISIHELLERQAASLRPGETGLLALDWWNGNRSILADADLSGLLIGATLATKPVEIYRALIEATAFATRKIIEAFRNGGIEVDELYASGGLAQKNALLLQIYADVTGMPIKVAASEQTSALGASMQAAVAAGAYPDIHTAARYMARVRKKVHQPNTKTKVVYDLLYSQYSRLHDLFGRDPKSPLKTLKRLRTQVLLGKPIRS
ncbi:MAG: ribulokinase [Verrucomicrobia bacterium]|nr:ribulokinase [Verrucomicrobiota bacterium]